MKNSQNNFESTIEFMESILVKKCEGIRVVLASNDINGMITPDDDSDYVHVYLLNVPGKSMLSIEDAAYDIWEDNHPESVCFFMYTPEETATQFSSYAIVPDIEHSCISAISIGAMPWASDQPHTEPVPESFLLVSQRFDTAGQLHGVVKQLKDDEYQPISPNANVAADTELALAA